MRAARSLAAAILAAAPLAGSLLAAAVPLAAAPLAAASLAAAPLAAMTAQGSRSASSQRPTRGDVTSVAQLVERLNAADGAERAAAYRELRALGSPAAVPFLEKRLPSFRLEAQSLGVQLLEQHAASSVRSTWQQLLQHGGPFLRAAAAAALWRAATSDGDRADTATALARAIADAGVEDLGYVLARTHGIVDERVRGAMLARVRSGADERTLGQVLFHLLLTGRGRDEPTITAAARLLDDEGNPVRSRAIAAAYLLAAGEAQHAEQLAQLLQRQPAVLSRLQQFLARAPRIDAVLLDAIAGILTTARTPADVGAATQVLQQHAPDRAAAALRELLRSDDERLRRLALQSLAALPDGFDRKHLRQMLTADDPHVVLAAADALRRMDDLSCLPAVVAALGRAGSHRTEAVRVLGAFRTRAAVPPLLDALDDAEPRVRSAALIALRRLWTELFPYRHFELHLAGFRADADAEQRARALAVLRAWWTANG